MQVSRKYVNTKDIVDFGVERRFFKFPVSGILSKEGITPNNPQVAIINALEDPKHRFVVACVSRRVGKSFIAYTLGFLKLLERNVKVLVVAPNYSLANIGWDQIKKLINKYGLKTVRENSKDKEIELDNGSLFKIASAAQPDSAVGRSYDFIIFDEAAISPEGGNAFDIQLRPTLDKPNSKALFISTPRGNNWFKMFYEKGFSDLHNWVSIHGTYKDNPRADLADIEEARRTVTDAYFRQEYEADFTVFEGQIFDTFNMDTHVKDLSNMYRNFFDVEEFETLMGIDVGYRDPTAILTLKYHYDTDIYYILEEYQQAELTTAQHAAYIQKTIDKYSVDRVFVDAAAAQFRQDLAYEHEIPSSAAKKSVLDGIALLQSLFQQDKIIIDSSCKNLIAALQGYSWSMPDNNVLSKEKPVHDKYSHMADALRYALYSIARGK
ncbi:terminase large subunit [Pectobacterium phage DU_PP_V]|uniref:Terminase large subunit n=1 Tax=Pectobacterium phage DU_PP_V TaxID=2041492 RepID=A0A2D2W738_9CAUD|nr:terminase large subunit [Pectobacterium phage DU_PP_V]ATS94108.1 terminase large subunit [Pectobacterium phage DU_PP_V]